MPSANFGCCKTLGALREGQVKMTKAKQSPGYALPNAPTYEELPRAKSCAVRGGPELRELQVRLEVVTPILGGNHQPGVIDNIDVVRAASVRGHLRFWWR